MQKNICFVLNIAKNACCGTTGGGDGVGGGGGVHNGATVPVVLVQQMPTQAPQSGSCLALL